MKVWSCGCFLLVFSSFASFCIGEDDATKASPLRKVIELLAQLEDQCIAEGEEEDAAYHEFKKECVDRAGSTEHAMKTHTTEKTKLEAIIAKCESDIATSHAAIKKLVMDISITGRKIQDNTRWRNKERAHFEVADADLVRNIDMLARAEEILEKELQNTVSSGGAASLLQTSFATQDFQNMLEGLSVVMSSAGFMTQDTEKLASLMQMVQEERHGNANVKGASSQEVLDMISLLKAKAENTLKKVREKEVEARHAYNMIKETLEQEVADAQLALENSQEDKAAATQDKAEAEGELEITNKAIDMADSTRRLAQLDCQAQASDHGVMVKGRENEVRALNQAREFVQKSLALAQESSKKKTTTTLAPEAEAEQLVADEDSMALSFLQHRGKRSRRNVHKARAKTNMVEKEVLQVISKLAQERKSEDLTQLASRISTAVRYGVRSLTSADPFTKIKRMIRDMISKLTREMLEASSEKDFCDQELRDSEGKKEQLNDKIQFLQTKIDQARSRSARVRREIEVVQEEIVDMDKQSQEMIALRAEEHKAYEQSVRARKQQLENIRTAIDILRDYYRVRSYDSAATLVQRDQSSTQRVQEKILPPRPPAEYEKKSDNAWAIVGMLETVESDVASMLAQEETREKSAQYFRDKEHHKYKAVKGGKQDDIRYMTTKFKALEKSANENKEDQDTQQEELNAVNKYLEKVTQRCSMKKTLAETQAAHEAEIKGLQEAKAILMTGATEPDPYLSS